MFGGDGDMGGGGVPNDTTGLNIYFFHLEYNTKSWPTSDTSDALK